ncbi:MAG: xanthine dehydrogenase family protein molybdopterin-binding subunit, partial [Firmicutes bacterium]|nr:xanthine dehydrogenase family protein molybdopterin-binding subunit [Bacillota bacterium]
IPTAVDLPKIEALLLEIPDPEGPFGARGIGEPPLMAVTPAIANAVYDAVGIRFFQLPFTPEEVRLAIRKGDRGERDCSTPRSRI